MATKWQSSDLFSKFMADYNTNMDEVSGLTGNIQNFFRQAPGVNNNADLNNFQTTDMRYVALATTGIQNAPENLDSRYAILIVFGFTGRCVQLLSTSNNNHYIRFLSGASWTAWKLMAT